MTHGWRVETPDLSLVAHPGSLGGPAKALVLREVRYGIGRPGSRTRQVTPVTTQLDAEVYRVATLLTCTASAGKWKLRWHTLKPRCGWMCCTVKQSRAC